jgi:hypothetical protein
MKRVFVVLLFALTAPLYVESQGGIYMTKGDYRQNQLTYRSGYGKTGYKIRLHNFFGNTPSFIIINDGKKEKLKKSAVYGFVDCKGNTYRFYEDGIYKIVDSGGIFIYTQQRNITKSKGYAVVTDYFFSNAPDGNIFPLNMKNLVNGYRDNHKFLCLLENYSGDANAYDSGNKTFRISYLYTQSQCH